MHPGGQVEDSGQIPMQGVVFSAAMDRVVTESRGHASGDQEESLCGEIGKLADESADASLGDFAFPAIALSAAVFGLLREFDLSEIEAYTWGAAAVQQLFA